MDNILVTLLCFTPIMFVFAIWWGVRIGERITFRTWRREIDAGREYLQALDEATSGLLGSEQLQVTLQLRRLPREEAVTEAPLRTVSGKNKPYTDD